MSLKDGWVKCQKCKQMCQSDCPCWDKPKCAACNDEDRDVDDQCQECCPHDERDHGICLMCGHEKEDWFQSRFRETREGY